MSGSTREKGDNTLGYYSGNLAQLLVLAQLNCRRAIVKDHAFPCPMDFEYTVELMFNEQAQQFVHRKCECIAHHALQLLTYWAGLEAPVELTKGIRSLVSSLKCHLLLLTVPGAKE